MHTNVFAIFGALLLAIKCRAYSYTSASAGVVAPSTVIAGTPATATISAVYSSTGDTSAIRGMQVFLAMSNNTVNADPFYTESECYLTQLLPLCGVPGVTIYADHVSFSNYTFNFTVPSAVGQPAYPYTLRPQILLADGTSYGPGLVSNTFNLTGITGRRPLFPPVIGPAPYFPCIEYNCVTNCALSAWGETTEDSFVNCANKCPDVSVPSNFMVTMSVAPTSISGTGCVVQTTSSTGTAPATTATTAITQTTSSPTTSPSATSNNAMPRFSPDSGSFSAMLSSITLLLVGLLP